MLKIILTKSLGLEIWVALVNGKEIARSFSENGIRTRILQLKKGS